MFDGSSVLAVVPARSGSKGIRDKNLATIGGTSLIGIAARVLADCPSVDVRVLSTDSEAYADEGRRHGLAVPFLRPPHLSHDAATAVDTMAHAVEESERHFGSRFDVVLIVEPTSPLRTAADVEACIRRLVETGTDSAVAVSPVPAKFHPLKVLKGGADGRLDFYEQKGAAVTGRQQLAGGLYFRNGVCYALTRACLMDRRTIFTENTVPVVIERTVVNIDDPEELEWARFLWEWEGGEVVAG
ncbi:MAG TPA: acylneuraminate cytidylyltransferase family protein [Humisphaera sp.]